MRNRVAVTLLAVALGACGGHESTTRTPRATPVVEHQQRLDTVFIGDSITQGLTGRFEATPAPNSWVRYVVDRPGSPWHYRANVAAAGETLGQMAERFDRDVLGRHPDVVVIMGGTNDAVWGLPRADSLGALRSMIEAARAAGLQVWVVAPPPLEGGFGRIGPLRRAERRLVRGTEARWIDAGSVLVDEHGEWLEPFTFDGVHPTISGAQALAAEVLRQVAART